MNRTNVYDPASFGTPHDIVRLDFRGRSVRCAKCLVIVVHPFGDTDAPYVHWTDTAPTGKRWIDYATRQAPNGRLIVPTDWRERYHIDCERYHIDCGCES